MNRNIGIIFFLVLILASVFAYTCTITSPVDNNEYNYKGLTLSYTCDSGDKTVISKITFNGDTNIISGTDLTSYISSEGTYTIDINATYTDGNIATDSISFKYDTTAPTATFSGSLFTNDENPELSYSVSSGTQAMKISCDQSTWRDSTVFTITNLDITEDNGCNADTEEEMEDDGTDIDYVDIYAKFVDKAGNWSAPLKTTLGFDVLEPTEFDEADFEVAPSDEMIIITWNNIEMDEDDYDDDKDFIAYQLRFELDGDLEKEMTLEYNIDEDDDDDDEGEVKIKNLENGESYDLEIFVIDKAGNETKLEYDNLRPQGNVATIKLTPTTEYAKAGDKITATCTFSDDYTNDAVLTYKYTGPATDEEEIDADDDEVSGTVTISSTNHSRITFYCSADGAEGDTKYLTIDNNKPTIEWKDTNNLFVGVKRLEVYAKDNLVLSQVEIDFNNTLTKLTNKNTAGYYTYDLNSVNYPNGNYTLKAIATDGAGNKTTIERSVTLNNYTDPKDVAKKEIENTKAKQRTSTDLVNYYNKEGLVIPTDLNKLKTAADSLLAQAESELNAQPEKAKTDAINAALKFDEFNTGATTQVKETVTYAQNTEQAIEILQKYGLSAEDANNQLGTMQSTKVARKLIVVQTGSSNNRQIKIEISFVNNTNSDVIKIVEVIPKELLNSARNLVSEEEFRIIKDDPVVEFTVNAAKGATTTISYGIGEVDSIKAQEMITNNVINLYETAPVILEGTLSAEDKLTNLTSGTELLILVIALIVLIVIIAVLALFFKFKNPGHGFGEEKTLFEHATKKEKENPKKKFEAFK